MERNSVCLDGKERRGRTGAGKWCAMENNWVITDLPISKKGLYSIHYLMVWCTVKEATKKTSPRVSSISLNS
jgi:hypothetical protein